MIKELSRIATLVVTLLTSLALAQQPCASGIRIEGTITDATGAVIPGVQVRTTKGETATTDAEGHYVLPCIPATFTTLTARADGFARVTASARARQGKTIHVNLQLDVAAVQMDVQVSGDSDIDRGGDTTTLNTKAVQGLADDPDDFLRELQVLASGAGGDPTSAIIMVDGFQNPSGSPRRVRSHRFASTPICSRPNMNGLHFPAASSKSQQSREPTHSTVQSS